MRVFRRNGCVLGVASIALAAEIGSLFRIQRVFRITQPTVRDYALTDAGI